MWVGGYVHNAWGCSGEVKVGGYDYVDKVCTDQGEEGGGLEFWEVLS